MSKRQHTKMVNAILETQFIYTSMGFKYGEDYTLSSLKQFSEEALMREVLETAAFCRKCVRCLTQACIKGDITADVSKECCTKLNKAIHNLTRVL